MEAAAHYCQPKENPRKAEEEIALARKVAMIAAKAGARPAAADYGMSQEQFASVMSGGYSASGNEGQPQYAGGQDGTACNAAQNADSSAAQYGAAGIAGQMVRCRVTGQKAACRLAVWMTVMKHTLRPWAQRRMLRRKLPLRAARWFWQKQRQQRMGCARKHRQQGRVLRQWGRRQLLRQARTVPHRLAAEMQADRANTAKANSTGRGVAIIAAASKK